MSTTVLNTIPSVPEAPSLPTPDAAPSEIATPETVVAPEIGSAPTEPAKPDPDIEYARKFNHIAKREATTRKQEVELQQQRARIAEREKSLDAKMAELEAALEDPVEYYIKRGKDPAEVAKRFIKPVTEEEKRLAQLEKRLADKEQAEEDARRDAEERQARSQKDQFWKGFVREIRPEECPHLTSLYPAHQVPQLVHDLLNRPYDPNDGDSPTVLEQFQAKLGRAPTPKEIRQALESEAELRATSFIARRTPPVTPATATQSANGSPSLSNQDAASSGTAARPKTREERMKELKEQLEAEMTANE